MLDILTLIQRGRTAFVVVGISTLLAVIVSAPTSAQDTQNGMRNNMPTFADFDLNDDGGITANEFSKARSERMAKHAKEGRQMKNRANAPTFGDIDTNDDGAVSPDEFSAHQAEHKAKKNQR